MVEGDAFDGEHAVHEAGDGVALGPCLAWDDRSGEVGEGGFGEGVPLWFVGFDGGGGVVEGVVAGGAGWGTGAGGEECGRDEERGRGEEGTAEGVSSRRGSGGGVRN